MTKKKPTSKKKPEMEVTKETGVSETTEPFIDDSGGKNLEQMIEESSEANTDTDADTDPKPEPQPEYTMETCKVDFTAGELREMSEEMARNIGERAEKEDAKKAVATQFKAEIEALDNEISQLAVKVRNKSEYKPVKCEVFRDFTHKEIRYVRTDTAEIHRKRTMRSDELQEEMAV